MNGRTLPGAAIVWGWLRLAYCNVNPEPGRGQAAEKRRAWPETGMLRLMESLRSALSLAPVQMSTLGFLTSAAIFFSVAGGIEVGIELDVAAALDASFCRNVLKSDSSAATLT